MAEDSQSKSVADIRQDGLELMGRLLEIVGRTSDIAQVYRAFAAELERFTGDWAAVILVENGEVQVHPLGGSGEEKKLTLPLSQTTLSRVLAGKKTLVEAGPSDVSCEWLGCPRRARHIIWLPLLAGNKIFGAVAVATFSDTTDCEKHLPLLECFAGLLALALGKWKLQKEKEVMTRQEAERAYFLDVAVHDLKTVLTAIIAAIGLLREELDGKIDDFQMRLIHNLSGSIGLLESTVFELSDLCARGDSSRQRESGSIAPVLKGVVAQVTPLAQSKGQALVLQLPQALPEVLVDPRRLEKVMLHLISNAIRVTPGGGRITVRAAVHSGNLVVEVQDGGAIIPEAEQRRIFEPYYRDEADRQRVPGMGLGLAVAKQLVEAHGGKIWLSSQSGEGNTFAFALPCTNTGVPQKSVNRGKTTLGG